MDLFDKRFLFVIGKGGVGKTTVAASLGLAAAKRGKRTLIAMTNVKERLSRKLGSAPIGDDIVSIRENLDAVNMTPEKALEEYGMMILKIRALYETLFENRYAKAFIRGTPGIDAWSMLGKAYFHAVGHGKDGIGDYDLVILDTPATGHGLDMIRMPMVITAIAPSGLLSREASRALELFRDPQRGGAVVVTLPEDMPTNETLELQTALRDELRIPIQSVVVNQTLKPLFGSEIREEIQSFPAKLDASSPLATLGRAGRVRSMREAVQAESLERLKAGTTAPMLRLPRLFTPDIGPAQIEALSHAFQ